MSVWVAYITPHCHKRKSFKLLLICCLRRPSGVWCKSVSCTCLATTVPCWWGNVTLHANTAQRCGVCAFLPLYGSGCVFLCRRGFCLMLECFHGFWRRRVPQHTGTCCGRAWSHLCLPQIGWCAFTHDTCLLAHCYASGTFSSVMVHTSHHIKLHC